MRLPHIVFGEHTVTIITSPYAYRSILTTIHTLWPKDRASLIDHTHSAVALFKISRALATP